MVADKTLSRPVPVVRLIVRNPEGKVLILRRARTAYGDGAWCLPGGKVDYGETVEQAAAKELREETSLACESLRFLFYQDSLPPRTGEMHCINLYFECRVAGEVVLNPESSASSWIGPDDVGSYEIAFRNDEGLRRYWSETA
jgi:mutator protein MutT